MKKLRDKEKDKHIQRNSERDKDRHMKKEGQREKDREKQVGERDSVTTNYRLRQRQRDIDRGKIKKDIAKRERQKDNDRKIETET